MNLNFVTNINSQVADLGGTLGLFLGFSFLGFFDAVVNVSCSAINVVMKVSFWSGNRNV